MDRPFMLLSNVPLSKPPSTIKKKFANLTLGTVKQEQPKVCTSRKLEFNADQSILTDDDDDDDDANMEGDAEKENQIFNTQEPSAGIESPESPERVELIGVHIKQRYSEMVSMSMSDELDVQMSKLELSLTQPTSEPLFFTEESANSSISQTDARSPVGFIKQEAKEAVQNSFDSLEEENELVVTISSTNSSTVIDGPMEVIVLDEDEEEEEGEDLEDEEERVENGEEVVNETDSHFSGTLPSKSSEPNCSDLAQSDEPLTSSVLRRLSDFFNKIPDLEDPPTAIDLTFAETPPQSPHSNEEFPIIRSDETLPETILNDPEEEDVVVVREGDEDKDVTNSTVGDNDEQSVIENSQEDIVQFQATPRPRVEPVASAASGPEEKKKSARVKRTGSQEINIRSRQVGGEEFINISAKITVGIVIRTHEATTSSSEESSDDDDRAPDEVPIKEEKDREEIDVKREKETNEDSRPSGSEVDATFDPFRGLSSGEIAQMDTQPNFPEMGENFRVVSNEANTPKRNCNNIAEMDTVLNSVRENSHYDRRTSQEIAEMDTEVGTQDQSEDKNEESDDGEGIVLDDASIAILHSIYGDSWRTPQLMRSMKKTCPARARVVEEANSSYLPNMTDFQKFNENVRRDLESTRVGKMGAVQRTKSAGVMPKTPIPVAVSKATSAGHFVQSPYFSNKKALVAGPSSRRTPLKETPKYRKILQVVDTDTSDEEEEEEEEKLDSDDSFRISESDSETRSSSSASSHSTRSSSRRKGKLAPKSSRKAVSHATTNRTKSRNEKEKFDFTQIASSDSELDDTIFIDKDKVLPIPIKKEEDTEKTGKNKKNNDVSVGDGGKRKLFSDLNYHTPTSSISSPDEDDTPKKGGRVAAKASDEKQLRFPWLHDFTPVRHKTVDQLRGVAGDSVGRVAGRCGFLSSLEMKIGKAIADPEAVTYREGYKQKKEALADKLFRLYDEKVFGGALAAVPVRWNKKLLTTAGRCVNMAKLGKRMAEVELSEKVLTSADRLRCTLIHELCHAAAWIVDGEKKGHAGQWKKWTERAVKALPELPKITVRHDYNIEYKYTYQCTKCAAKTQMHSKTKKAENIRCRFCHGDIEILLNKKTKTGDVVKTPVRAASGFALYVKENYKKLKQPQLKHADVMKMLSQNFAEMKVQAKE